MSEYKNAKYLLRSIANDAKQRFRNDKPMIRQIINDSLDSICRDSDLSEYKRGLLANYACKLHPK